MERGIRFGPFRDRKFFLSGAFCHSVYNSVFGSLFTSVSCMLLEENVFLTLELLPLFLLLFGPFFAFILLLSLSAYCLAQ